MGQETNLTKTIFAGAIAERKFNSEHAARYGLVASLLRAKNHPRAKAELAALAGCIALAWLITGDRAVFASALYGAAVVVVIVCVDLHFNWLLALAGLDHDVRRMQVAVEEPELVGDGQQMRQALDEHPASLAVAVTWRST